MKHEEGGGGGGFFFAQGLLFGEQLYVLGQ